MLKETLNRIVKTAWTNFRRHGYVSFGTTGVMTLVLLLFLSLLAVNFLSSTIVASLQEKVDVSVYFKTDTSDDEIGRMKSDLEALPQVASVAYVSREEALADFKSRHAGDALIQESLAELDVNPLQASLNVKAKHSGEYASIVNSIEANRFRPLVDKINFYENEQVIKRVESISRGLQNWGFLSTLLLSLIAVLVTFNTIRLTIYNQKQEIEIMRLVGGSNWHIKAPYLVEGMIYGGLAATAALIIFYPAAYFVSPKLAVLMPGVSLISYFLSNALIVVPLIAATGVLLGVISSFVAIRRFLKV